MEDKMSKKLFVVSAIILSALLLFSVYQPSNAVPYYGHDGSIDKYMEKVKVQPYKGKKDLWVYIVKACATDHSIGVAGVILKSDIDQKSLGVNKNIAKGQCSYYGAVMKAKDGNTLGAELIQKHQALEKVSSLKNSIDGDLSRKQIQSLMKEISYYRNILGGLV
jgi:hypothetical protein